MYDVTLAKRPAGGYWPNRKEITLCIPIGVSELMMGKKQLQETEHSTLLLGCFYLLYVLYSNLSRMYCC